MSTTTRRRSRGQLVAYKSNGGRVRWSARYVDATGKRTQETIGYDLTAKEAREKLEELLVAVRTEHRKKQKPVTFELGANQPNQPRVGGVGPQTQRAVTDVAVQTSV